MVHFWPKIGPSVGRDGSKGWVAVHLWPILVHFRDRLIAVVSFVDRCWAIFGPSLGHIRSVLAEIYSAAYVLSGCQALMNLLQLLISMPRCLCNALSSWPMQ